jgi:hypothetical protein
MKKSAFTYALIAASLLTGTMAHAEGRLTNKFFHPSTGYDVSVYEAPRGISELVGVHKATGETFKVVLSANGKVTGDFRGKPVSLKFNKFGKLVPDNAELASQ